MQKTNQLRIQFLAISVFALLPVIMVVLNGTKALRGILSAGENRSAQSDFDSTNLSAESSFQRVNEEYSGIAKSRLAKPASRDNLVFGVYDPDATFNDKKALAIRHFYLSWADFDASELRQNLRSCERQGYQILLTIEPWPIDESKQELTKSILDGRYDHEIAAIADVLAELNTPTYISWGHEMDQDLIERYPWSGQDPEKFVAAYRYVVNAIRERVSSVLFVWTGVLKEGSQRYWPGKEYADYVGLPIYSFPHFDQMNYGFIRNFETTLEEKLAVVRQLEMPIFITELGVCGSPDFEAFWLREAFGKIENYSDIAAVVFYFSKDVEGAWGDDLPTPDWRVHPDAILGLVQWKLLEKETLESNEASPQ